jgi:hypothetical protein
MLLLGLILIMRDQGFGVWVQIFGTPRIERVRLRRSRPVRVNKIKRVSIPRALNCLFYVVYKRQHRAINISICK